MPLDGEDVEGDVGLEVLVLIEHVVVLGPLGTGEIGPGVRREASTDEIGAEGGDVPEEVTPAHGFAVGVGVLHGTVDVGPLRESAGVHTVVVVVALDDDDLLSLLDTVVPGFEVGGGLQRITPCWLVRRGCRRDTEGARKSNRETCPSAWAVAP